MSSLFFAEIIAIIVCYNQHNRVLPSENDTSYVRLYHYYTDYVKIISIMAIIQIISLELIWKQLSQ